jgi:hypothetical protein
MKRQAREAYGFVPRRDRGPLIARLILGAAVLVGVLLGVLWR